MRKLLLTILLISFLCLPVFSDYEEKERFNFTAYYQKQHEEKYVTLDVYDSRLNSGIIMISNQEKPNNEEVFFWEITGNISTRVNLTFWFTPLQAYLNGIYYIPQHTFQLYKSPVNTILNPSTINGHSLKDTFLVKATNKVSFLQAEGDYPYPKEHTTGTVPSDFYYKILLYGEIDIYKEVNGTNKWVVLDEAEGEETTWTRSGYCTLTVESYNSDDGDYNYICNVKIEVSMQ